MGLADLNVITERVYKALDGVDLGEGHLEVNLVYTEPPEKILAEIPAPKADPLLDKVLKQESPIHKTEEERYVLAIVLEPLKEMGKADSQNDVYSAKEVRDAAYRFMEYFQQVGLQHSMNVTGKVKIIENSITRVDEVIDGETVKAGTWLMGLRVLDEDIWKRVKDGSLTGLSIGGIAQRTPLP